MKKKLTIIKSFILLLFVCIITHPMYRPQTPRITAQKIQEIVEARIATGKDLNLPINEIRNEDNMRYPSPLIVCCEKPPYIETIELLLKNKANPNISYDDLNPISMVCTSLSSQAHLLALKLLIDAGANLDHYKGVLYLCQYPQDEAILKNPELRIEAMELLLNAKAYIPYKDALIALLKSISSEIPAEECQTLLQERKHLISQLLRTNVGIFNKTRLQDKLEPGQSPDFFDIDQHKEYNKLSDELIKYTQNHETKRCKLNTSRYSLLLQLERARKKNPLSPFNVIPKDVIKQITLLVYPKMSGCS